MKNIAIIPARSGSKGLKDKNIKMLNNKPLIAYSIEAAIKTGLFEDVMVSTDSEQYASVAKEYGAEVPFLRSEITSGDAAGSFDVVREVLSMYAEIGKRFESICLLQPTSPLRDCADIENAYRLLEEKKSNAVTSVCEVDHSPLWTMTLDETLSLAEFRKNASSSIQRQKLANYYRLNGAIYIRKIEYTDRGILLLDNDEVAYIMEKNKSVDIDTVEDFEYAEFLIQKKRLIYENSYVPLEGV